MAFVPIDCLSIPVSSFDSFLLKREFSGEFLCLGVCAPPALEYNDNKQSRFVLEKGTPGDGCSLVRDDTQPEPLVMAVGRCHSRSGHESHGCRDAGGCGRGPRVSALQLLAC